MPQDEAKGTAMKPAGETRRQSGSEPATAPAGYIHSHMALRGIAALLVVAYHLQFGAAYTLPPERMTLLFKRGYLWVDLFFILSGFIIAYTSRFLERRPDRASVLAFYRSRVGRIVPLHWFCLAYIIAFGAAVAALNLMTGRPLNPHWSWAGAGWTALEALLLHSIFLDDTQMWNIPSWSISAEMMAYALFPLLAILARRGWGLALLPLLSTAFYAWVALRHDGDLDIVSGLAPVRCLAGFLLGICLCRGRPLWRRVPDTLISGLHVAAVAAIGLGLHFPVNDSLLILPFVALIGATSEDRGLVAQLLRQRPLLFLGRISYSVYLNHTGVLSIIYFVWIRTVSHAGLPPPLERAAWIATSLTVVILFSMWTCRAIEEPARRWLARRPSSPAP